jgi:hypothetical protein
MEVHWSYCRTKETGLLFVNGKLYQVPTLDAAIDLVERFASEMEESVDDDSTTAS